MSAEDVNAFIDELRNFLDSLTGSGGDGAVDPELLNALADYIEGVDPTEDSLDKLRNCLQSASNREHDSLEERMKTVGSRRSLKLLREALNRA